MGVEGKREGWVYVCVEDKLKGDGMERGRRKSKCTTDRNEKERNEKRMMKEAFAAGGREEVVRQIQAVATCEVLACSLLL